MLRSLCCCCPFLSKKPKQETYLPENHRSLNLQRIIVVPHLQSDFFQNRVVQKNPSSSDAKSNEPISSPRPELLETDLELTTSFRKRRAKESIAATIWMEPSIEQDQHPLPDCPDRPDRLEDPSFFGTESTASPWETTSKPAQVFYIRSSEPPPLDKPPPLHIPEETRRRGAPSEEVSLYSSGYSTDTFESFKMRKQLPRFSESGYAEDQAFSSENAETTST